MIDLQATFEKFKDEHGKFGMIKGALHQRPDLCAFLLLDKLLPGGTDNICTWTLAFAIELDVDCKKLAEVATERDILTLVRCGVVFDDDTNGKLVISV